MAKRKVRSCRRHVGRFQVYKFGRATCNIIGAQPTLKKAEELLDRENVNGWIYDTKTGKQYE